MICNFNFHHQVTYNITIDGVLVHSVYNNNPRTVDDVKVFASDNFFPPADASYKNLVWENFGVPSMTVKRNKLIGAIYFWGPLFRVSLDLIIFSFTSDWSNILAFKGNGGNNDCCDNGDRVPLVNAGEGGLLQFSHSINGTGNYWTNTNLTANTWYNVVIQQVERNNKARQNYNTYLRLYEYFQVYFTVEIDGRLVVSKENADPREFRDVMVFAGDNFHPAADAQYKNLVWENLGQPSTTNTTTTSLLVHH